MLCYCEAKAFVEGVDWFVLLESLENFPDWQSRPRELKFDLAVPVLTSLLKFYSPFDIVNRLQECASNRFQSSYTVVGSCLFSSSYSVCIEVFWIFASQHQSCTMKGRRPSTRSTSSRTGLVDSPGRKMLSEVLLVCELLLFITLAALTGGNPPSTSTNGQKKRPQVRWAKRNIFYFISGVRHLRQHFGREGCVVT